VEATTSKMSGGRAEGRMVRTYVLLGHDDVMRDGLPPRYRISMGQKGVWLSRRELEQRGGKGREHGGRIVKRDVSHGCGYYHQECLALSCIAYD
jgi:hypothetical protein